MVERGINGAAILTDPYPDNDKSEWVITPLTVVRRRSGMLTYSAEVHPTRASKNRGDRPFLINSWKSQIRAFDPAGEHQRIQRDDQDRMLHASGEHVAPEDVEEFLALPGTIQWQNDVGQFLPGFMFPTYGGVLEALDPQWLRERYSLDVMTQVDGNIDHFLQRAQGRRLDGDHRGTTLDYQVGASADDAYVGADNPDTAPYNGSWVMAALTTGIGTLGDTGGTNYGICMRFQGVAVAATDTIDVAYISTIAWSTEGSTTLNSDLFGEDADDAAVFVDSSDYNARSFTAAVADDGLGTWTHGVFQDSGSIVTPVTTIKDRGGWAKDNSMSFLWADGDSSDGAFRFTESYDSASAKGGKFHLEISGLATVVVLRRRREEE